ncbi:MAG: hypothetical protein WC860_05130 [Candidatus Margulisiibacteriota bacterium]|jgi:flagellar basal body rod protein FlgB
MAVSMNSLVYDKSMDNLANAITDATNRQAVHSYNLSNAATPGFKPIRFKDEMDDAESKYADAEFNLEEEIAKMTENRLRHSALVKILYSKAQLAKKIVTLGKGG